MTIPQTYRVIVQAEDGHSFAGLCTELLSGGMFVSAEVSLPVLFSKVGLRIRVGSAELHCRGEVVRQVSGTDATVWKTGRGFAIQFIDTTPEQKQAIARTLRGEAPIAGAAFAPLSAEVQHLLRAHWETGEENHYELLGLRPDCELSTARRRSRECRAALEEARPNLDPRDRALMQPAIERVNQAMQTLTDPMLRAEYDAAHHNFIGVSQCIAAGLTISDLEKVRRRHLSQWHGAAANALVFQLTAHGLERAGEFQGALRAYESALREDPLNFQLHLGRIRSLRGAAGQAEGAAHHG